ncbi:MAG: hypothetical protein JNL01_09040 [Bdellovibrionales bacterium]|nr:hypothetical protein [Bdellovibrionales bacterium]
MKSSKNPLLLPMVFIVLGCLIRFIYPSIIEYKADEALMFDLAKKATEGDWARLGIPSSQGVLNPGMSVWIFGILAKVLMGLGFELNPITLSMSVAALACAAFGLSFWVGLKVWKTPRDQMIWFWGVALVATHPIEILLQRKIWAQSVIPFLMILIFYSAHRWVHDPKKSRFWAFLTGLMILIPGQIHMPALFLAASILGALGWMQWKENRKSLIQTAPYLAAGLLIGLIPMIPWFQHAIEFAALGAKAQSGGETRLHRIFEFSYLTKLFTHTLGLNIQYTLRKETLRFLGAHPWVLLFQITIAAGVMILLFRIWKLRKKWRDPETSFLNRYLIAVFIGYGIILTLAGYRVQTHYFCAVFPWTGILLAYLIHRYAKHEKNWILPLICGLQLISSVTLLDSLRRNGGAVDGEFGRAYQK